MKTIVKIIILLLFGLNAKSQSNPSGVPAQNSTSWYRQGWHQTDSGEIIAPRIPNFTPRFPGTTILYQQNGVDTSLHYWTGLRWIKINAQGIDTTSLSNRINLKLNISDTVGKWLAQSTRLVDTMYRVNDSTVGYTIKGNPYTFQILGRSSGGGGGGSGTVTSVGLSMPSAFSVSGSPITSSGTFSVSGAGTSLQYIRGNGTLATFDTAAIPNFYLKVRGLLSGTSPITFNQTTGAIGINNANTTGTKGAASFTSAFSDNGSGLIDMADLVSSGSCTGCELTIDSKGRITAFATGAGGATNNTNIGSGFRPVNVITQEMRTYFGGFGTRLDSVANANGLTWSADTTRGTGLPTYFYVDSIAGVTYANNGLYKDADTIKWGQPISTVGNPAALTYNTEIPLNGFNSVFTGTGGLAIGTSTVGNRKLNIAATSSTQGINITTVDGTSINLVASGTANGLVAQTSTGTAVAGNNTGASGYGVLATSANSTAIPFKANTFSSLTSSATPVVAELVRNVFGVPANGVGLSIMFRGQTTTTTDVETGQIRNYLSTALHGSRSSAFEFHLVNNAVSARKALLASTGQWTWDGYSSLTAQTDTTTYKPVGIDGSGNVVKMAGWAGSGGGGGGGNNTFTSDIPHLSEIKIYSPAQGVAASASVTNYNFASVDSTRYMFSTTRAGTSGNEYGGWLVGNASGDSIKVTAPFWVVFGDSQAEGHPGLHGRLHPLVSGVPVNGFIYNYPDSVGQLSYHLRQLTNMRWYNQGIGGQTTVDLRKRFYRDVLGVNSPNSTDGRSDQTLSRKPDGVVIIAGINDIFNGVPAQTTKENLEWMASQCQQTDTRCVILNMPGDEIASQSQLQGIASMNNWLASGVMDQYGASVVDYNSWWNDPTYGYDNIHHTSLIVDDIHPSKVGYDSLASYIYRQALLPKLTKAAFINELSPTTPINYARPANITINSSAYSIASLNDTINITTFVPDSVWIKVISSTPITDNDTTGFSHIVWKQDNNPLDSTFYTRKTLYSGSQKANMNVSQLTLIPPTAVNGFDIINIPLADLTTTGFKVTTYAGGTRQFLGGTTIYNSASLNITNSAIGIGMNGSIYSEGNNSQIAAWQMMTSNGTATTTGVGQSVGNTESSVHWQFNPSPGKDQFRMSSFNNGNVSLSSGHTNILSIINTGFGNAAGDNENGTALRVATNINQATTTNNNININGIAYVPNVISTGNARHRGFFNTRGSNYFNALGDSTAIGIDSNGTIGAKLHVNGTVRIDGMTAPASTYNVLVHGLTDSILYQVPASAFGGTTLYTGNGSLSGNRTVTGGSNSLTFDGIFNFRVNANTFLLSKSTPGAVYTTSVVGAPNIYQIGYTPTATVYGKGAGLYIDTNNNAGLGGIPPTTMPLYATGLSTYVNGFQNQSGNFYGVTNVTGNVTANLTNYFYVIDATSGNITITLPAASTAFGSAMGIQYVFKRIDNSGNTVQIVRNGSDTIDGSTSVSLSVQYESKELQCVSSSAWAIK